MEKGKLVKGFYNGLKFLDARDEENKTPTVYIAAGGRNIGKTTWWYSYFLWNAVNNRQTFIHLCRQKNEINGVANNFITNNTWINPETNETVEYKGKFKLETIAEGFIKKITYTTEDDNDVVVGYAVALSKPDKIKNTSKLLEVGIAYAYFDECILEISSGSQYLTSEIEKLQSVLNSIFRLNTYRLICCTNLTTSICPLFCALHDSTGNDLTQMIEQHPEARHLKGVGWVYEVQTQAKQIANHLRENNRAFSTDYLNMATSNVFRDSKNLIDRSLSKCKKVAMFNFNNNNNLYVLSRLTTGDFKNTMYFEPVEYEIKGLPAFTLTHENIDATRFFIGQNSLMREELRAVYNTGKLLFYDIESKNEMLEFLKY